MSRWRERFHMSDAEAKVQAAILEPIGDSTSEVGALRLKKRIEDAWTRRGQAPPTITIRRKIVHVAGETRERFELWSDMKNGRPVEGAQA